MNYPRLEWFVAVVDEGSISGAAAKLYASPQSISAYIMRLEQNLGFTLFNRNHGFQLSQQGQIYYTYAKKILERDRLLKEQYFLIKKNEYGRIRFGLSVARARALLPQIVPQFNSLYPGVSIIPCEHPTPVLEKMLDNRELDVYVGKEIKPHEIWTKEVLHSEKLYAIATTGLLKQYYGRDAMPIIERFRQGVSLQELTPLPFVAIDPSRKAYRPIDDYCDKHHISLKTVIWVAHTPQLIDCCEASLGAGLCFDVFLPQIIRRHYASPDDAVNVFPVTDDIADWKLYMAYIKSADTPDYYRSFLDLLRQTASTYDFMADNSPTS